MTIRRLFPAAPAALAALAILSGCMVGPDYEKPPAPVPVAFKELAGWKPGTPLDTIDRGAWWSVYRDPVLDGLIRQIDISNQTLRASEAAFRQARAIVQEARSGLFPTVNLNAGATRTGTGGGSTSTSTSTSAVSRSGGGGGIVRNTFDVQGQVNWTLDVWGRIRRTVESDVAGTQASAADLAAARLSAQAELATDYFDMRAADSLYEILTRTVEQYRRALQIAQNQYDAGVTGKSDVITAQTQLLSAQSQLVNVGVQRAQFEHAIALLAGKAPAELTIPPAPLAVRVPVVPASLPSALLERRPDIAAAERRMQQQNALIGVAVAAWYPDISLSALYGYSGDPLRSLIQVSNRVWSFGAAATETLFDGGLRSAQVEAARAAYDESVANYRETVLTAFRGVEDALSTLRILEEQAAVQDQTLTSARQSVQIALNEYRAGTVPFTTVVTAQTTLLSAEQTALTIRQNRLAASAALIQNLGGGWNASQLPSREDLQKGYPLIPVSLPG